MEVEVGTSSHYALLTALIMPRPIAWVSTVSADGVVNLAPFSYFNLFSDKPPLVAFAPANRPDGSPKDTLANLNALGEFVLNLVTRDVVEAMNASAANLPAGESEAAHLGLELAPSVRVKPPRVARSLAHVECVVRDRWSCATGPGASTLVIGEIVHIHVADSVMDGPGIDPAKLIAVGRLGGTGYCDTASRFDLPRPQ